MLKLFILGLSGFTFFGSVYVVVLFYLFLEYLASALASFLPFSVFDIACAASTFLPFSVFEYVACASASTFLPFSVFLNI